MKQVYLINTNNRAAAYGVGTYINQIVMCLRQADSLCLTVVELDSDEKETVLIEKDNVRYLKIPRISNDLYNTYTDRYNRNISYLLSSYVKSGGGMYFSF